MTEIDVPRPPRSKTLRLWLILGSVAAVLGIIPIAVFGMMSVMATDAGVTPWVSAFVWTSLTFPVAVIAGPILAWIAYALRRERLSWILLFVPLAWPVAITAIMIVGPGAA